MGIAVVAVVVVVGFDLGLASGYSSRYLCMCRIICCYVCTLHIDTALKCRLDALVDLNCKLS